MEWFVYLFIVLLIVHVCEIKARQAKIRKAQEFNPEPIWGASFATEKELRQAGLFRGEGSPLGYAYESGKRLHFPAKRKVHRLSFGGSGVGKTSHLIEIAAEWPHSLVVPHDIGGELAFTTAHYRRKFGKVVIVDFYGLRPDLLAGAAARLLQPDRAALDRPERPPHLRAAFAEVSDGRGLSGSRGQSTLLVPHRYRGCADGDYGGHEA